MTSTDAALVANLYARIAVERELREELMTQLHDANITIGRLRQQLADARAAQRDAASRPAA